MSPADCLKLLRHTRPGRAWSAQQVAHALTINPSTIEALEEGHEMPAVIGAELLRAFVSSPRERALVNLTTYVVERLVNEQRDVDVLESTKSLRH